MQRQIQIAIDDDIVLEVLYNISCSYMRATMVDPEEHPECEIESVSYAGIEIDDYDSEIIETACWEHDESFYH